MGCQWCQGHSALNYYMSGHPTQPKDPVKQEKASEQFTIMHARDSLQNHNFIFIAQYLTSPYDLLLDGTAIVL